MLEEKPRKKAEEGEDDTFYVLISCLDLVCKDILKYNIVINRGRLFWQEQEKTYLRRTQN